MRPTHADRSFPRPSRRAAAVTLTALTLAGALAWPARARAQSVDAVLEAMPFSSSERQDVHNGQLVTTRLPSSNNRELAVAIAFTMDMTPAAAAEKFRRAIYRGDPKVIAFGTISDAAEPADFAKFTLGPQGASAAQAFLNASPGESLNLSSAEIASFAALNAQSPSPAQVQPLVEQQLCQQRLQLRAGGGWVPSHRCGNNGFLQ